MSNFTSKNFRAYFDGVPLSELQSVDSFTHSDSGLLWMQGPEEKSRQERWAEAAPKLAMALSEAGYPTTYSPWSFSRPGNEHELSFARMPPKDVFLKACEICGISDFEVMWPEGSADLWS